MPKVAILDSGIHAGHPHVGEVLSGFNATGMGADDDWLDRIGHGTAVAGAIRSFAPDSDLLAVKIFEGGLRTNIDIILRGIEWALDQGADLINLSLGTTNEAHAARLSEWVAKGSIWLSAATAYPGMLDGVIGINLDPTLERNQLRLLGPMRFAASPYPQEIPGVSREKNLQGISFAVANATGLLASSWAQIESPHAESAAKLLATFSH
jgi:hypothetical protein